MAEQMQMVGTRISRRTRAALEGVAAAKQTTVAELVRRGIRLELQRHSLRLVEELDADEAAVQDGAAD
jgi:hypothetical protein